MKQRRRKRWAYWLLWVALVAMYLLPPMAHLNDYAWDYDEGPQIQAAALAYAGYPLYSEVALNKPPLLTWLLQLAFHLGGMTVSTARLAVLSVTLVGFVALGLLAEQWWGRGAGPAAMALFLALPEVPVRAAALMNDLPAMSAALVALVAATCFHRMGRWPWLVACAAAYVAVLGFHPILFFVVVPIVLILLMHPSGKKDGRPRKRWLYLVVFGLIVVVLTLISLSQVDWSGAVYWIWEYNTVVSVREMATPWEVCIKIAQYLSRCWITVGLAVVGGSVLSTMPSRRSWVGVVSIWFITTLGVFVTTQSLRYHYLLFLLYPLVIMAGGGIVTACCRAAKGGGKMWRTKWQQRGLAAVLVVGAFFLAIEGALTPVEWSHWTPEQRAVQAFLQREGASAGFVVSDDQFLAFAAGHLVPPSLADTSYKRIRAGLLHLEDVIGEILQHRAQFVVFGMERFTYLPSLEQWTEALASQRQDFGSTRIYRIDFPSPSHSLESSLGGVIRLRGYHLSEVGPLQAGGTLTVTLYWESTTRLQEDFTVFVHLIDDSEHLVGQHDSPPVLGWYPTRYWRPNTLVPDPHPIVLDADLTSGAYRLLVGMYRWPSLERLPAFLPDGSRWPHDRILLAELHLIVP